MGSITRGLHFPLPDRTVAEMAFERINWVLEDLQLEVLTGLPSENWRRRISKLAEMRELSVRALNELDR